MKTISHTPADDTSCGWFHLSPPRNPRPAHRGKTAVRWAVVGAGVTGLAAARQLAMRFPDDEIALIDAQPIGHGASGRNSGFIIDLPHDIGAPDYIGDIGHARMNLALNKAAQDLLVRQIADNHINCDLRHSGKYQAAIENRGLKILELYRSGLDRLGAAYDVLDAKELPGRIGTNYYRGALFTPGTLLVQPAALVKGLADTLPANVHLFENTAITGFSQGSKIVLKHERGEITADELLLTNNAFAAEFGFLHGRILPIFTYASITRQLREEEQRLLGGEASWGIIPAHPFGTTLRRTPDNRILIRNTFSFNSTGAMNSRCLDQAKANHRRAFERRFPMLRSVEFQYAWGGAMGLTRNHVGHFGRLAPKVSAAVGCNGLGLTRGTITGTLLADWLAGERNELIEYLLNAPAPARNPPEPFLSFGVRANLWFGAKRAGLES